MTCTEELNEYMSSIELGGSHMKQTVHIRYIYIHIHTHTYTYSSEMNGTRTVCTHTHTTGTVYTHTYIHIPRCPCFACYVQCTCSLLAIHPPIRFVPSSSPVARTHMRPQVTRSRSGGQHTHNTFTHTQVGRGTHFTHIHILSRSLLPPVPFCVCACICDGELANENPTMISTADSSSRDTRHDHTRHDTTRLHTYTTPLIHTGSTSTHNNTTHTHSHNTQRSDVRVYTHI